jgi:hypothetical protein
LLAFGRVILSVLLVSALVTAPVLEARAAVVGVVVQANRAQLGGAAAASVGTTIFDGDSLSTAADGSLRMRAGAALVYLGSESGVTLKQSAGGAEAVLNRGLIVLSAVKAGTVGILANGASLRPAADVPTIAQVRILGPKELHVVAERGAIQFTYNGESEVIPEGASYRVVLDPPANMPAAQQAPEPTKKSGKYRKGFLFLLFGIAGGATIWAVHEALESPDRP